MNVSPTSGLVMMSARFPHVAAASPEALVEHDDSFVVLGHVLEHSVRGHGYRVPEPHHPTRQQHLNLPVVARQPHPDPNYAPHAAARRVAGA